MEAGSIRWQFVAEVSYYFQPLLVIQQKELKMGNVVSSLISAVPTSLVSALCRAFPHWNRFSLRLNMLPEWAMLAKDAGQNNAAAALKSPPLLACRPSRWACRSRQA